MSESNGRINREQAECFVDRVLDELGSSPLAPGVTPPPEHASRLTTIRIDCIGVANLGTGAVPTVASVAPPPGVTRPMKVGEDPALDALYNACQAGSGPSCDRLFELAPVGSDYETLALTCGGRTPEARCADVYPDPTAPTTVDPAAVTSMPTLTAPAP